MKRTRTHIKFLPSYSLPIKVPTLAFLLLSLFYFLPFAAGRDCSPAKEVSFKAPCERTTPEESARAVELLGKSPAVFIENQGQWEDETIRFALSSMGANVGLTDEGMRFQLFQRESEETEARMVATRGLTPEERSNDVSVPAMLSSSRRMLEFAARFEGARRVVPEGEDRSEQVFHYHRGEQARWRENVPSWDALLYRNLYNGIDLRVIGKRTGIKFEFIVAPGAEWHQIRVRYDGIEGLALRDDGSLEIRPAEGWPPLLDAAPYIYQEIDGQRHPVEGRFALVDSRTWHFEISGNFDPARQLIIDPELEWSTYLGGSYDDYGGGIAVDGSGNIVLTGVTYSSGWVSGGFDTTFNGGYSDAFVAKLSPSGAHLWSTYLGGSDSDVGQGIAVDASGNILVTGWTFSSGWVSGGFDTTFNGGYSDAFVARLSPSGAHLWSTYLGGDSSEEGYGIAVDGSGNIVVTGKTWSSDWVSGGFDTSFNGYYDAFVAKLSPSGAHLWSTYLGGGLWDWGQGIAVDGSGNIVVTGDTNSIGWVSGGFNTTYNGGARDLFVAKLAPEGAHLWSTYLGGSDWDYGYGIAADASGNIVVTGETYSIGWVSGGFDTTFNGSREAFVAKLSPQGAHLWSTYLGGTDSDDGYGIAVDGSHNIVVTGGTWSSGWISGGFDTTYNGFYDAFVAKLSPQGAHLWSTYLGGSDYDYGLGIALDGPDNIVLTGGTGSSGWVSGGFDTTYNGDRDAFVVKIRDYVEPSPIVYYTFVLDEEGWTTGGAAIVFSSPDSAWEPDFLTMTSRTNTNTFGFWRSPQDAVPADPGYLYRARFNVSTDLTPKWLIPQIRLSANSLNFQQYDVLSIESSGDGGASPSPSGTNYDLHFVPPANDIAAMLAFDLLNFNPDDAAVTELALDTVTVDRFALVSLGEASVIQDYTFETNMDGWTTGSAAIFFSAPQYTHAAGALELRALTNTDTFGYWVNDQADITIEGNKLYRGIFEVRTDVTNQALVPEMRLRFNTGNFQASSTLGIVSAGDGANSPGTTNTTYDRLYFLPPANCVGESLIVSFDVLNFSPDDAAEASLILDRAIIETLSLPALP